MTDYLEVKKFPFNQKAVDLLSVFCNEPYVFLLESSLRNPRQGRYSFLGYDPFMTIRPHGPSSLAALRRKAGPFLQRPNTGTYPFTCGLVGFLSYDFGLALEKIPRPKRYADGDPLPDYCFGFYDCVLMVDHYSRQLYIFSSGLPEKNVSLRKLRAQERLKAIIRKLGQDAPRRPSCFFPQEHGVTLKSNFTKKDYIKTVKRALKYIYEGDIYQVNLAQRYQVDYGRKVTGQDAFLIYRLLRELSPSCFSGYFDAGDFQIISSSPERFLKMRGRHVETRPMKGTRPRSRSVKQDQGYKRELLASAKDRAELLMITDLERNDLGQVCDYGSVRVDDMRTLESYKTVYQTTSTVSGHLREDKDCFDLLEAAFPGGSITGCPKIRSMQIIDELETDPRGIYTGAMGYIGFNQSMDFNILIRTLLLQGSRLTFHVGGGIVADSDPLKEYEETLVKASAMQSCLKQIAGLNKKGARV